jgi:hypothetical protein
MSKFRRLAASLAQLAGIVRLWCHGTDGVGDHDVLPLFRVRVMVGLCRVERVGWERDDEGRETAGWKADVGSDWIASEKTSLSEAK